MCYVWRRQGMPILTTILAGLFIAFAASAQCAAQTGTEEAFLIRQDSSDCTNSNVNANDPSRIGGTAWVVRGPDGNTRVKVAITATPNTVYHFFLKCVRALGDLKTEDEGEAIASFEFPTSSVGSTFAFDMYPEGAPAGNKYQSIQLKLP
jgi:hypothetical protein